MFCAANEENIVISNDNIFNFYEWDEVETIDGWKSVNKLVVGDILKFDDDTIAQITNISQNLSTIKVCFGGDKNE